MWQCAAAARRGKSYGLQMVSSSPQTTRQPPAVHLLADPEMVVQSAGVRVGLSNVTKEPKSPILVADQPWEIWISYVSVVYAPEIKRLVFYYTNVMCCDASVSYTHLTLPTKA